MKARRAATAPFRGLKALGQMIFRRQTWRMFGLPRSRFDYLKEVGDGTGSSTVMAPLQWIGRNFPEAPPAIWRTLGDGEEEQDNDHDLIRLLARPNPHYSGAILWMATLTEWHVDGNAYWLKIRDRGGRVRELWWTPSFLIDPKGTESEYLTHYEYRPEGVAIPLEPEDVVHFRHGLDPDDTRKGRSPLKSVLREVFTDDEAANFTASLLRNMGVPGLVVSPKGEQAPGEDDVKATKDYVREETTGDRRGEPLVMSGPTEVEQFGFSPEQLDLKALRRIPEERVTAAIGLPAIVAGLGAGLDRATFANYAEARQAAYEDNIIPSQRIFAEDLRFHLLTDFEDDPWAFRVGFDLRNVRVLQEDRKQEAERLDIGVRGGWVKVAEARRSSGLETDEADEIFLRPVNLLERAAGEAAPEPDDAAKQRGTKNFEPYQTRIHAALERDRMMLEAALGEELETDFDELGELAAAAFEDQIPPDALTGRTNGDRKASDETLAERVTASLGLAEWRDGKLRTRLETHYRRVAGQTVETISTVLDLEVMLPDEVEQAIVHQGGTRRGLTDIRKDTRDAITRAIAAGREAGEGPPDIARRIRSEVPAGRYTNAGSGYRANLIARSETKYAQNLSSLGTYREAPTVTRVIAFDGTDDAECAARNGTTYSFDDAQTELAAEHPNGTLSFAPVVAESLSEVEGAIA